jgi:bacterioferritin-associated ferredoxin
MYICLCKGISDQQIIEQIGSKQQLCAKDLCKKMQVGADCGTCLNEAIDLIEQQLSTKFQSHFSSPSQQS